METFRFADSCRRAPCGTNTALADIPPHQAAGLLVDDLIEFFTRLK
jgi:hypothetical protein